MIVPTYRQTNRSRTGLPNRLSVKVKPVTTTHHNACAYSTYDLMVCSKPLINYLQRYLI